MQKRENIPRAGCGSNHRLLLIKYPRKKTYQNEGYKSCCLKNCAEEQIRDSTKTGSALFVYAEQ